jgi:hypothetical protein
LILAQLEETLAVGTLSPEEAFLVVQDRDRDTEPVARLPKTRNAVWKSMLPAHATIEAVAQDCPFAQVRLCPPPVLSLVRNG